MKTYVFITNDIGNIGGGQIYLAQKARHLMDKGWKVQILHFDSRRPMIEELKPYADNHVPGLRHRFATLPPRLRKCTLRQMARMTLSNNSLLKNTIAQNIEERNVGERIAGRIVVESYSLETSFWGEAFAAYLAELGHDAAHFCYILTENTRPLTGAEKEFLYFKFRQGLLRSMMHSVLHNLAEMIPADAGVLLPLSIGDGNIEELPCPKIMNLGVDDFVILMVTRLEKPFVAHVLKEIMAFAALCWQRGETVRLIIAGGSHCGYTGRRLRRMLHDAPGLTVDWWGFIWPMPAEIYHRADVFVGNAGAAREAAGEGIPTVTIDAVDFKPIGILGETTDNYMLRRGEAAVSLVSLLGELRQQRDLRREARKSIRRYRVPRDYTGHDIVAESAGQTEYFPVETIPPHDRLTRLLRCLNGIGLEPMVHLLKQIRHHG